MKEQKMDERVIEMFDPGHAKGNEIRRANREIIRYHTLMNEALADNDQHSARYFDALRFNAFRKWMRLKGEY